MAGDNPISVSKDKPRAPGLTHGGEKSPTCLVDPNIHSSWTEVQETPEWYAKGADVDALLDIADALDWIEDSGDHAEQYKCPTLNKIATMPGITVDFSHSDGDIDREEEEQKQGLKPISSVTTLLRVDSTNVETMVPTLPSLFPSESTDNLFMNGDGSYANLKSSLPSNASIIDTHLQVCENSMEEHAFVSTILENIADEKTDNRDKRGIYTSVNFQHRF